MAEALWVQAAGVDYGADEDRRLIASIWNPGVITGLVISAGTGLAASVSAGKVVIPDGQGGSFLAYFDTSTSVTGLAATTTNNIYATVNPTTGQATLVSGTVPANPNVRVGAAITSATAVTSTSKGTSASSVLQAILGTSMTVSGSFIATSTGVSFPKGFNVGTSVNAQMRYSVRAARALTRQLIAASTWSPVLFDRVDKNVNDYGGTAVNITGANQGLFVAPIAGTYQVSGQAHFVNQVGTPNTRRQMRVVNRTSAGAARWIKNGMNQSSGDNVDVVTVDGTIDMLAGQTVEFQVFQDETHSVYLSDNSSGTGAMSSGDMSYGMMTLLAAD